MLKTVLAVVIVGLLVDALAFQGQYREIIVFKAMVLTHKVTGMNWDL